MYYLVPKVKELKYQCGEVGDGYRTLLNESIAPEGYIVKTDPKGILVEASTPAGYYYAGKTIEQIKKQADGVMPSVEIYDAPRYKHRGFLLDCARHFFTVSELKKQIRIMAHLKLNRFHWHLTDDQGWRIEIPKYPRLTQIGSMREGTRGDGKPVVGFYTQEQIKEIVDFCADRFIEVIPEFDLPGHLTAAIASYPELGCTGQPMKVGESFGVFPEIACVGKGNTVAFVKDVLDDILRLFPSRYIHIGGDEAIKLRWFDCPDCQRKIRDLGLKDEEELQGAFLSEIIAYLNQNGRKAIVWNDGLSDIVKGDYAVQYWKLSTPCTNAAIKAAKEGKEIILSPFYSYYLDYPCGMTPMGKTYKYMPREELEDGAIGMEAALWTEYVDSVEQLEHNAYPRLFAVAERAWSEDFDYTDFCIRNEEFCSFLKGKYPVRINPYPNPSPARRLWQTTKFFVNVYDKTMRQGSIRYAIENGKRKKRSREEKRID